MTKEEFRHIRKSLGLKQTEFSQLLGYRSQGRISSFESGERAIPGYLKQSLFFFLKLPKKERQKIVAQFKGNAT